MKTPTTLDYPRVAIIFAIYAVAVVCSSRIFTFPLITDVYSKIDNPVLKQLYQTVFHLFVFGCATLLAAWTATFSVEEAMPTALTPQTAPVASHPHLLVGVCTVQGPRPYQEDRFSASLLPYAADSTRTNNRANPLEPAAATAAASISSALGHSRGRSRTSSSVSREPSRDPRGDQRTRSSSVFTDVPAALMAGQRDKGCASAPCPHKTTLVSVFDGHGGPLAAHIAAEHVHAIFAREVAEQLVLLTKARISAREGYEAGVPVSSIAEVDEDDETGHDAPVPPTAPTNAAAEILPRAFVPVPPPAPTNGAPKPAGDDSPLALPSLSLYPSSHAPPEADVPIPPCHSFAPLSLGALSVLAVPALRTRSPSTSPAFTSRTPAASPAFTALGPNSSPAFGSLGPSASPLLGAQRQPQSPLTDDVVEDVDVGAALARAYHRADALVDAAAFRTGSTDGCTAVSACVWAGNLVIAHAGDARAVLIQQRGHAHARAETPSTPGYTPCASAACSPTAHTRYYSLALTADHTPHDEKEAARVRESGGRLVMNRGLRVEGVLTVSRALGDRNLKPYVIPDPALAVRPLEHRDSCVVLASDGVWATVEPEEVGALLAAVEDEAVARVAAGEDDTAAVTYKADSTDLMELLCTCTRSTGAASRRLPMSPRSSMANVPADCCAHAHAVTCRYVAVRTRMMGELARRLVAVAVERGSKDNVTAAALDLSVAASGVDAYAS